MPARDYKRFRFWWKQVKEGKGAIKWTRLLCRSFAANAVRLQRKRFSVPP